MREELLRKEIRVKELFRNSFLDNSVQFNEVEVTTKDNSSFVRGVDFSNAELLQEFNSEICVSSDKHLIKLHFSLEGTYCYQPLRHIKYLVQIPENHCNMF